MRTWITVLLVIFLATAVDAVGQGGAAAPEKGWLDGQVLQNGKPITPGAIVACFDATSGSAPDKGSVRRVPQGLVNVDRSSRFRIGLAPGKYYLGVVVRTQKRKGPPGPNEDFFFARDKAGKLRVFEVIAGQTTNIGWFNGKGTESFPEIANAFTVEGKIFNEQGKPFGGALILVRADLMVPRPLYISGRTGKDGSYQLKLVAGGPYYLVVRENLVNVGRPAPGNFIGIYGSAMPVTSQIRAILNSGKPISGKAGEVVKGIDIVMYGIPNPEELQEKIREQQSGVSLPPGVVRKQPSSP
ncbi:MAG: carboxypeptidase-like regulatory domain-containing protein [Thermodesulfobacteriota bacterium]